MKNISYMRRLRPAWLVLMAALTVTFSSCREDEPLNPTPTPGPVEPTDTVPEAVTFQVYADLNEVTVTTATIALRALASDEQFTPAEGDSLGVVLGEGCCATLVAPQPVALTRMKESYPVVFRGLNASDTACFVPYVTIDGERTYGDTFTLVVRSLTDDELATLAVSDAAMPSLTLNGSVNLADLGVDTLGFDAGARLGFVIADELAALDGDSAFHAVPLTDGQFALRIDDRHTLDTLYYASQLRLPDGRMLQGGVKTFTFADTDILTLDADSMALAAADTTFIVAFTSSRQWTVAISQAEGGEWLSVDAGQGDATLEGVLTFHAVANEALEREAVVTLSAGEHQLSFVVTQEAGNLLCISPESITVTAADTTVTLTLSASHKWSGTANKGAMGWVTATPASGEPALDMVVTLHIDANDGLEREGKYIFTTGTQSVSVSISQEAGYVPDEERYRFLGTWPQSALSGGSTLCGGELQKYISKFSGSTYYARNHMGSAFERDHKATAEEVAWLEDYTAKPASMDGFSRWTVRGVTLYPFGKPMPADCNQHSIGDCNTVSTLADMAYLYPDFIMSIIEQVGNRQFRVKMFDPKGNRIVVCVDNTFLCDANGNIAQMTGKNNRITWGTVLEKAIMKWLYVYRPGAQLGGFGAEGMTPLFTGDGRSFAVSPGTFKASDLAVIVTTCLRHGLIVNGGFNKGGLKLDKHETITGHGHSFLLPNKDDALFAIRNPWGQGSDDHVMQCYDDGVVPPTIDLRIISPGIASLYYPGTITPYQIPKW